MSREELFAILRTVEIDVDDLAERLMGNMALITRFLRRFPDDKSYKQLKEALDKGQCEEAFRAAHAFKGVCSNLSMTKLYRLVGGQVEVLRRGDLESGLNMMQAVSKEYNKMVDAINDIKWE